jgi:hypothetical protein
MEMDLPEDRNRDLKFHSQGIADPLFIRPFVVLRGRRKLYFM